MGVPLPDVPTQWLKMLKVVTPDWSAPVRPSKVRRLDILRIGVECACKLTIDLWSRYIPKVLNEELCRSFFAKIKDTLYLWREKISTSQS